MTPPSRPELVAAMSPSCSTSQLAEAVLAARERQRARLVESSWTVNSDVPGAEMRKRWPLGDTARAALDGQLRMQKLSARSADRVLGLSWTVADLRSHDTPDAEDVELALALRRGAPLGPGLRGLVA
jgi:magnesium chelatase family protein